MSTTAVPPRRRSATRRFLRSYFGRIVIALILIVIVSTGIWWKIIADYKNELRIAQRIEDAGGSVVWRDLKFVPIRFQSLYIVRAHRRIVEVKLEHVSQRLTAGSVENCKKVCDLLNDLKEIRCLESLDLTNMPITDADLREIGKLKKLTTLNLSRTQITDAGIKELANLEQLTTLTLCSTYITGMTLGELSGLQHLWGLELRTSRVTDMGLKEIPKLKHLTVVSLFSVYVTDAGMADLENALPNVFFLANGLEKAEIIAEKRKLVKELELKVIELSNTQTTPSEHPNPLSPYKDE